MNKNTARKALDSKIASLPPLQKMQRPHKGWIRAVKEALGMSSKQLAARLGVSAPRITALEKSEVEETVTLASLRRAAEALDCALVYSFVPKGSFEEVLQTRARRIAAEIIGKVDHTMRLEAQNLQSDKLNEEIENLAAQILREQHKIIWDKR
jgi:predicted DNA-binding mobile mystery protein A